MKKSSLLLIAAIVLLFLYNDAVAQVTIIKSFTAPNGAPVFLGAANMDNDQQQELVYWGSYKYKIVIIDGSTGTIEWESPTTISAVNMDNKQPFCDVNNDGKKEISFYGEEGGIGKIFIVGLQGSFSMVGNNISIPDEISISQNYPNPFNPSTTIEYQIQKNNFVNIKIFDSIGRLVKNLVNEEKQSGEYSVIFDGKNDSGQKVSSGVYYYQLQVGDFISNKKMILLK
ncbi:MAG: T9SS C-terminal target domain-containing protein [Stygiobacter sp.]|nr:MAG: T9SS C-terminal target domain-containing protein [Stygiobacter sp.]